MIVFFLVTGYREVKRKIFWVNLLRFDLWYLLVLLLPLSSAGILCLEAGLLDRSVLSVVPDFFVCVFRVSLAPGSEI